MPVTVSHFAVVFLLGSEIFPSLWPHFYWCKFKSESQKLQFLTTRHCFFTTEQLHSLVGY